MRFQQETNTMDVEQLKLLKGRFNPKTLVAVKRGLAVVIRHTVSDRCQTFSLFVDLARRALALPRVATTPASPICPLLLLPSATEGQANAILHCTVLTGDFGDRIGLKVANRTAVVAEIFDY